MIIQNKITNALVGGAGLGASVLVEKVQVPDISDIQGVVNIVVQIAIGVATLWGLFKKKRV